MVKLSFQLYKRGALYDDNATSGLLEQAGHQVGGHDDSVFDFFDTVGKLRSSRTGSRRALRARLLLEQMRFDE